MFVQDHHSLEELQQLTKALAKKRIWLRYQAVVLAKQGHSAPDIAYTLSCSRRAVQTWIAKYNHGGVQARPARIAVRSG
jgi:transposase